MRLKAVMSCLSRLNCHSFRRMQPARDNEPSPLARIYTVNNVWAEPC